MGRRLSNKKEQKKSDIFVTIIFILTMFTIIIGTTYAYFSAVSRSAPQIITTKNLNLNVQSKGTASNVNNIIPTNWNDNVLTDITNNKNIVKIPFIVTSTSRTNGTWGVSIQSVIMLNPDENMVGGDQTNIKYKLYDGFHLIKTGNLSTNEVIVTGSYSMSTDVNKSYDLYVYIEENNAEQNKLQGISFDVTLVGNADQTN